MNSWRKAYWRVEPGLSADRRKTLPARNGGGALLKVAALGLLTLLAACDRNATQNVVQKPQGTEMGLDAQFSADGARRERLARVRPGKVEARAAEPQPKELAFAITPFDLRLASRNAAVEEEAPQREASVVAAPSQSNMTSPRSENSHQARRLQHGALSL